MFVEKQGWIAWKLIRILKYMKGLFLCLLILPSFSPGSNNMDWTLRREQDGINIYSRPSAFSKFNDTRVDLDLPGTIRQLAGILRDVNNFPDWVYSARSSRMIKKINDNEVIYYSEIDMPWPASNRDYYADQKISFDETHRSMNVLSVGMKDYQPEKKDLVRVERSRGCWSVTTKSGNTIHLQYVLEIDPGGGVPAWIANNFADKAPLETFTNLKKKMEELNR
jgi:hypothetical protein